ncbi:hypothetical protein SLEP1_g10549 [Rubroshorea leprosula]|uniref:Secreted protein n=1 Tax=Rubroshorea leprosula TaxID=152421 RepID=A0AAV5IEB0_9ROSI|nr:hypothetical protein SLEP1_g10549 [Rubroshorea leprosula]
MPKHLGSTLCRPSCAWFSPFFFFTAKYHPSQTTSAPPSLQLSFFGFCCLKQILELPWGHRLDSTSGEHDLMHALSFLPFSGNTLDRHSFPLWTVGCRIHQHLLFVGPACLFTPSPHYA